MIIGLLTRLGIPQWLAELLAGAVVVLSLVGGSAYLGYHYKANIDQVAEQKAQLAHDAAMIQAAKKAQEIEDLFDHDEAYIATLQDKLHQEVPHVTTVYRTVQGAPLQPLPRCVFTSGFVSVWNGALDPGLPDASGGSAEAPATSEAAGADLDSGVTEHDILDNHIDNAAACGADRAQLNALIDFYEQTKGN